MTRIVLGLLVLGLAPSLAKADRFGSSGVDFSIGFGVSSHRDYGYADVRYSYGRDYSSPRIYSSYDYCAPRVYYREPVYVMPAPVYVEPAPVIVTYPRYYRYDYGAPRVYYRESRYYYR